VTVGWRERTWSVGFKHAADVQKVTDEGSSRESAAMLYWAHARAQGSSNAVRTWCRHRTQTRQRRQHAERPCLRFCRLHRRHRRRPRPPTPKSKQLHIPCRRLAIAGQLAQRPWIGASSGIVVIRREGGIISCDFSDNIL